MSIFKKNKKPEFLISSCSPICDIEALVEQTEDCIYFYLRYQTQSEDRYMNSCWVCNRKEAPMEVDYQAMEKGEPPMMPAEFCKNPAGEGHLKEKDLAIVWLEEGNGAALMEGDKLLALVPPWACEDMPGYSIFCKGTGPFAWSMDQAYETLMNRVKKSVAYWKEIEQEYWPSLQSSCLEVIEDFMGSDYKYYAIDGGEFPPKALVRGEREDIVYGLTLGVCILSQPNVEQYHQEEYRNFCRIEIGFACTKDVTEEKLMDMLGRISGNSGFPWRALTWLGHDHTISCDVFEGFPAVTLVNTAMMPELAVPRYPDFMGERVNLLWMVPITAEEYEKAREKDMPVDVLMSLYQGDPNDLLIFDGTPKFIK